MRTKNEAAARPFPNRLEVGGDPDRWGPPVSEEEGAGALLGHGVGPGLLGCALLQAELRRGARGGPSAPTCGWAGGESRQPREVKSFSFSLKNRLLFLASKFEPNSNKH